MNKGSKRLQGCGLAAIAISIFAHPAVAQPLAADVESTANGAGSTQSSGLADIVVTATRRATNVQDVPIAISAISGDALRNRGITDPRQLSSLAPNLQVDQGISNGATHVSIRGLASTDFGLGASSPVAIYIDDIYQPFQYGIGTQAFDLNRVEVLRGPQGTLFGKNTTGGALNYYSQTPTHREEGYFLIDAGGGDYGHYAVEGAFNRPVTDNLDARLSFRVARRDDYVDNLFDGGKLGHYNNYNARLQLAWAPGDTTKINLKIFGLQNRGDGPIYISQGPSAYLFAPDSRHVFSEVPTYENYENYGATLKIDQELGGSILTSITGYQKGRYKIATNDDGAGVDFFHSLQWSDTWQISQELRLATPASAPLRAVVGLFGQYDSIDAIQGSAATNNSDLTLNFVSAGPGDQKTTTLAVFASTTYEITDKFSVTGGLRYSYEHKKISVPYAFYGNDGSRNFVTSDIIYHNLISNYTFNPLTDYVELNIDKHSWKRLTWDFTANYKPSDDILLYAKAATGFRSGGYPVGITGPGLFVRLNPETVNSYEAGFKTEWFDRKLRINGALFWMDYKNMQVQSAVGSGFPGLRLSNAGKSRVKGIELELEAAPVTGLHLSASVGYNDAKYRQYEYTTSAGTTVLTGNNLPYAPRWTSNAAVDYAIPVGDNLSLTLGTDWTYRTAIYFDAYNLAGDGDPKRLTGNARIGFGKADGGWTIAAYVNNLTNRDMAAFAYPLDAANGLFPTIYAPKRTWGAQLGFKF